MKIRQLVEGLDYTLLAGSLDREISSLRYDSRKVEKGSMFVCISSLGDCANDFMPEALENGAICLVVEREVELLPDITYIKVENSRRALAQLAATYFDHPAKKLKTIGITGTKGKTTTTYLVKAILEAAGIKTGLIGTIETVIGKAHIPSEHTTPESYQIQEYFRKMVDEGIEAVVMEVSSQALKLHRVAGIHFDVGVFTNLSPDHIGGKEHSDFEDYLNCKRMLFQQCKLGILNGDSPYFAEILHSSICQVQSIGINADNDIYASDIKLMHDAGGLGVAYHVNGQVELDVNVNVPGEFSVYNSLTAIAICLHFGVTEGVIREALRNVQVKGRVEIIPFIKSYTMIIDYAHNAVSLQSLLTTLRAYQPSRLICMFGCGGNRARSRRCEMGEVSSRLADLTVITSDNPRYEEPMAIIEDILVGVKRANGSYATIPNRKDAIKYCMEHASCGDIVVLAGKGHEDYQEIRGIKYHMDERELIKEIIEENSNIKL